MKTKFLIAVILIINCQLSIVNCSAQYLKICSLTPFNGQYPKGSLISDGTYLYGMASFGGANNDGDIFKIKPDGTGYTKLHTFSNTNGQWPTGSLVLVDSFLYGMTTDGVTPGDGVIFKIKPDGTGYAKLLDFNGVNGSTPMGSLISDGTFLYGMTSRGGTHSSGVIFKIKHDGTGDTTLLNFTYYTANGNTPQGDLVSDGTFLYGMTACGGTGTCTIIGEPPGCGTIFKIKRDGTGDTTLFSFDSISGSIPTGSLIFDSTYLYGMTSSGGENGYGTIFKIKRDGTGFSKLFDFDPAGGFGLNGTNPTGSLVSDGTFLYGMTEQGGTYGCGVFFKIKPDGTMFAKLLDFSGAANGCNPYGSLLYDGNFLYGMTSNGGTYSAGTIFKYALTTGIAENNSTVGFTIYPNPNNGKFQLSMENFSFNKSSKVFVLDVLGNIVQENEMSSQNLTIDISSQTKGMYFVKIENEQGIKVEKIIYQ